MGAGATIQMQRGLTAMSKPMTVKKWHAKSRWIVPSDVLTRVSEIEVKLAASADYRERQSHAKALAFCCTSVAVSEVEFSADNLTRIMVAGQTAKRHGGSTELLSRSLLHIARRRLNLLGLGEPETLVEKKKRVSWDGGCVAVGSSAAVVRNMMPRPESEIVDCLNAGAFYMVNVGGDGRASLTLRIVDFVEPMLSSSEFAKAAAVSDIGWLKIEDGMLLAGAAEAIDEGAQLSVAPGRYLARLFSISSGSACRLAIVACRSNASVEKLRNIPSL
jgi:hypothetical protein